VGDEVLEAPCAVCGGSLRRGRLTWCARCSTCGTWRSSLEPRFDASAEEIDVVPESFRALRKANARQVLDHVDLAVALDGARLLDVGCDAGWFLEEAAARGAEATGIEPSPRSAAAGRAAGLRILEGLFPAVLPAGEQYDVVAFNDVFEHIPDVVGCLAACRSALRPGGVLVINAPNARGAFFRAALVADRAHVAFPLERLWQTSFSTPHLWYFEPDGLARLCGAAGFLEFDRFDVPTVRVRGLWERLRLDAPVARAVPTWAVLAATAPVTRVLPGDSVAQLFRAP
jgi:SAM-dependent methyltransferase